MKKWTVNNCVTDHTFTIQQLSVKLQDTLEMAEESLDVALSKVCVDFHGDRYRLLIEAYGLLGQGKTHSSMDQLLMHLTSAIHNTGLFFLPHQLFANSSNIRTLNNDLRRFFRTISFLFWLVLTIPRTHRCVQVKLQSRSKSDLFKAQHWGAPSQNW